MLTLASMEEVAVKTIWDITVLAGWDSLEVIVKVSTKKKEKKNTDYLAATTLYIQTNWFILVQIFSNKSCKTSLYSLRTVAVLSSTMKPLDVSNLLWMGTSCS